jgi:hypothetical protein
MSVVTAVYPYCLNVISVEDVKKKNALESDVNGCRNSHKE